MSRFVEFNRNRDLAFSSSEGEIRCLILSDSLGTLTPTVTFDPTLSMVGHLIRRLKRCNPGVTVTVKTLGIGGAEIRDLSPTRRATVQAVLDAGRPEPDWLATEETATGLDRDSDSWLDFAEESFGTDGPTLIVKAFGRNDRHQIDAAALFDVESSVAGRARLAQADQIWITPPRANVHQGGGLNTAALQLAYQRDTDMAASLIRSYARHRGEALMDVHAFTSELFGGYDVTRGVVEEVLDAQSAALPWTAPAETDGEYGLRIVLPLTGLDLVDANPATEESPAKGVLITTGRADILAGSSIKITTTGSFFQVTRQLLPALGGQPGRYGVITTTIAHKTTGNLTIDLWIRDGIVRVALDGTEVMHDWALLTGSRFAPAVSIMNGATPTATISYWKSTHPAVAASIKPADAYPDNVSLYGGNRFSHPAADGFDLMYGALFDQIDMAIPTTDTLPGGIVRRYVVVPTLAAGADPASAAVYDIPLPVNDGWFRLSSDNPNFWLECKFSTTGTPEVDAITKATEVTVEAVENIGAVGSPTNLGLLVSIYPGTIRLQSKFAAQVATAWGVIEGRP